MLLSRSPRVAKVAVLVAGLTLLLAACMTSDQQTALNALNHDRTANNRATVAASAMLTAKAQHWADVLAMSGKLSHSTLTDGITGCWRSIGENVGYGGSIAQVEAAYMNSPGHKANILNANFDLAGTGVTWSNNRVYTVQVFMDRC